MWGLSCIVLSLQMEPEMVEQPQAPRLESELPNGMEKVQVRELERRSKLNVEELNRIEDEDVLDKMVPLPPLGSWEGEETLNWWQRGDADLHLFCSWIRQQTLRSGD